MHCVPFSLYTVSGWPQIIQTSRDHKLCKLKPVIWITLYLIIFTFSFSWFAISAQSILTRINKRNERTSRDPSLLRLTQTNCKYVQITTMNCCENTADLTNARAMNNVLDGTNPMDITWYNPYRAHFLLSIPADLRFAFETKRGNFKYSNESWDVTWHEQFVSTYRSFILVSLAEEQKILNLITFRKLIYLSKEN